MENQTSFQSKRTIILLIILIVSLILAGFFWFNRSKQSNKTASEKKQTEGFKIDSKELGKAGVLTGFPANFPQLPGTKILQNTEYLTNDGRLQSTKKFVTPISVQGALSKYTKFFVDLGWTNSQKGPLKSPTLLANGRDVLMILAKPDADSTNSQLEITIIQGSKTPSQVSSR